MPAEFNHFNPNHGIYIAYQHCSGEGSWVLKTDVYMDYDAATGAWYVNSVIEETEASDDPDVPFEEVRTETQGPFTREEFDRFLADMNMEIDPDLVERLIGARLISPRPVSQSKVEHEWPSETR